MEAKHRRPQARVKGDKSCCSPLLEEAIELRSGVHKKKHRGEGEKANMGRENRLEPCWISRTYVAHKLRESADTKSPSPMDWWSPNPHFIYIKPTDARKD